jgi:hypothetical protein
MDELTFTKGIYIATATARLLDNGQFQGVVSLSRDDAETPETTAYETDEITMTEHAALNNAKNLANRILGEIEL